MNVRLCACIIVLIYLGARLLINFDKQAWMRCIGLLLLCGLFAWCIKVSADQNAQRVDRQYAAAAKQGIVINVKQWRQQPVAVSPCRIELKFVDADDKSYLVLPDNGKKVSRDIIAAMCDLLK